VCCQFGEQDKLAVVFRDEIEGSRSSRGRETSGKVQQNAHYLVALAADSRNPARAHQAPRSARPPPRAASNRGLPIESLTKTRMRDGTTTRCPGFTASTGRRSSPSLLHLRAEVRSWRRSFGAFREDHSPPFRRKKFLRR